MVHRFPTAIKAFYMEPDPERPELSLSADILAPEGYGEIVGGGERMSSAEHAAAAHPRAQAARGGVPLVPRPAPLRQRAPRRLRHGHRARRHLDLRPRAPARDDRLPAHAVPDLPLEGPSASISRQTTSARNPNQIPAAVSWSLDDKFLNGTGAGQPLGLLADPALITVTKETSQSA